VRKDGIKGQALAQCQENPDLILLDLMRSPKVDGSPFANGYAGMTQRGSRP